MPELRQNMATKEWVIIAAERAKRPEEFANPSDPAAAMHPEWDPVCPFCPGNEELDLEVLRVPEEGPWHVRGVRNKYPALQYEGERVRVFDGVQRQMSGVGHHEVLIETPIHNLSPALETPAQITLMLRAFQQRGRAMAQDPRTEHIIYFKNHGLLAGSTLVHPHTQIISLPIVPNNIRTRTEEARRYFEDTGRCVIYAMQAGELQDGSRVVLESTGFASIIPYAASSPFHTWILPRRHECAFLNATTQELDELGQVLGRVLRKLYVGLNDPDYNYVIRSAPIHEPGREYLHWYITIIPRVSRAAGFEIGTGMYINPSLPEESAAFLRSIQEEPAGPAMPDPGHPHLSLEQEHVWISET
jgi:UDPglucose--hexose-1-phosphate uridylyltransferase